MEQYRMWSDLWSRTCFALFKTEMLLDSLVCICMMCGFQLIFSSIITPRNLFPWTLSICTPSICICTCSLILRFPNNIIFVLFKVNDNLFLSNHIFNLLISLVTWSSTSFKFSPEPKIFVSSANNTSFNTCDTLQISLIYNINSLGPNTDPWGTPQTMSKHEEQTLPSITNCCLFCR